MVICLNYFNKQNKYLSENIILGLINLERLVLSSLTNDVIIDHLDRIGLNSIAKYYYTFICYNKCCNTLNDCNSFIFCNNDYNTLICCNTYCNTLISLQYLLQYFDILQYSLCYFDSFKYVLVCFKCTGIFKYYAQV